MSRKYVALAMIYVNAHTRDTRQRCLLGVLLSSFHSYNYLAYVLVAYHSNSGYFVSASELNRQGVENKPDTKTKTYTAGSISLGVRAIGVS